MINKVNLEKLRIKYGAVHEVVYTGLRNDKHSLVVRKPTFDEYLYFNKYSINYAEPDQPPQFEVDPAAVSVLFTKLAVYPEDASIGNTPPGIVMQACVAAMGLCELENPDKLRQMYIDSITHASSVMGVITQRIIMCYGIQGYLALKDLDEKDVIDLLVFSEMIQQDLGMFAQLANIPNLPWKKNKQQRPILDLEKLLGVKVADNGGPKNPYEQKLHDKVVNYYKSLGMNEEEIAKKLNERDKVVEYSKTQTPDGKVDINSMSDDKLQSLSAAEYKRLQEEGKILSFEESQRKAFIDSQLALQEQIARDKANAASAEEGGHFKGDTAALLKDIKQTIATMDL